MEILLFFVKVEVGTVATARTLTVAHDYEGPRGGLAGQVACP